MDEDTFDKSLKELIREAVNLPIDKQKQLKILLSETKQQNKKIKNDMDKITESLTNLRICIKYLLFDLEATRRERNRFKTLLEDRQPPDSISGGI